ncbi:hypothetical protein PInf_023275 [Phytophthora infestans]|nr:hypothetical protein PInf_023275 [Phytophthora infestans]
MGCAVWGRPEGDKLTTDPCTVCGKQVHHMCAIGVFEGNDSALNEGSLSNICSGSDFDFVLSPYTTEKESSAPVHRAAKRQK